MTEANVDLMAVGRGSVVAPAGCGKTELIASTLSLNATEKPILVLTHTNAGVDALRQRLRKRGVSPKAYRVSTIDGWAIRLTAAFPQNTAKQDILRLDTKNPDYPAIHRAARRGLVSENLTEALRATYRMVLVDEYQDCSKLQHELLLALSKSLNTVVLGDPLQSIFGFRGSAPPTWAAVEAEFPNVAKLGTPHRWINAGAPQLGEWLLSLRTPLLAGEAIDITSGPPQVTHVRLSDDSNEAGRQRFRAATDGLSLKETRLVLVDSKDPALQRRIASRLPGAIAVEAVGLSDLGAFTERWHPTNTNAFQALHDYATEELFSVARGDKIATLVAEAPSTIAVTEAFKSNPGCIEAANYLEAIAALPQVRSHRPAVLAILLDSLRTASAVGDVNQAFLKSRETLKHIGRTIHPLSVGSTLKLKGLEADVAVVFDGAAPDANHLYVAITRASRRLIICSSGTSLP